MDVEMMVSDVVSPPEIAMVADSIALPRVARMGTVIPSEAHLGHVISDEVEVVADLTMIGPLPTMMKMIATVLLLEAVIALLAEIMDDLGKDMDNRVVEEVEAMVTIGLLEDLPHVRRVKPIPLLLEGIQVAMAQEHLEEPIR